MHKVNGEWKYSAECHKCGDMRNHWMELADIGCNICNPIGIQKFDTGYYITGEINDICRRS